MRNGLSRAAWLGAIALPLAWGACDRGVAPFVPGEKPAAPDLAHIFPDQSAAAPPEAAPPALPQGASVPGGPAETAAGEGDVVRGEVRVVAGLSNRIPQDALLFLIVRAPGGGPPLAVKRVETPNLPFRFEIGPDDRMIAARPFAGPFTLSAWIDVDGNVMTRGAGDLQGEAEGTYEPGASAVEIVIDEAL